MLQDPLWQHLWSGGELTLIVNNQNIINAGILYDNTFDKKLSLFVKNQNITNAGIPLEKELSLIVNNQNIINAGILYDNTFVKEKASKLN